MARNDRAESAASGSSRSSAFRRNAPAFSVSASTNARQALDREALVGEVIEYEAIEDVDAQTLAFALALADPGEGPAVAVGVRDLGEGPAVVVGLRGLSGELPAGRFLGEARSASAALVSPANSSGLEGARPGLLAGLAMY
jgi:hypothetical protein